MILPSFSLCSSFQFMFSIIVILLADFIVNLSICVVLSLQAASGAQCRPHHFRKKNIYII